LFNYFIDHLQTFSFAIMLTKYMYASG
jgi:hypothetical protein